MKNRNRMKVLNVGRNLVSDLLGLQTENARFRNWVRIFMITVALVVCVGGEVAILTTLRGQSCNAVPQQCFDYQDDCIITSEHFCWKSDLWCFAVYADQETADRTQAAGENQRLVEPIEESRTRSNQQRCKTSFIIYLQLNLLLCLCR